MKALIILIFAAGVAVGSVFYLNRPQPVNSPNLETQPDTGSASGARVQLSPATALDSAPAPLTLYPPPPAEPAPSPAAASTSLSSNARLDANNFVQMVDLLVSPASSYAQRHAAWKQLADDGKLDQAIDELERRVGAEPRNAEAQAALGEAYLKKCAVIHDLREQGILAMQADKVFDTALQLEPANWEARFTKAVALSYWPPSMNKGDEVIQHFRTLIQQQEAQAPQPQFAESYSWLGDQYQKAGQSDNARATWERGAALFPDHEGLKNKLASVPARPPAGAQ